MSENTATKEKKATEEKAKDTKPRPRRRGPGGPGGRRTKNRRKPRRRRDRGRSEFDHRVVDIRRVARVMAGGRRFSFSVTLIAGDRKGRVGVGVGKANDTASAIDKALRSAKQNILTLKLTKEKSIPHEVHSKYASAQISIFPTPGKGGITAGGAVRTVLELGGVKDVGAKILSRSKNKLNNARATVKALEQLKQPKESAKPKKKK